MFQWGREAKKGLGTGFSQFCPCGKWGESQKKKEGGGGGEERFLPSPAPSPSFLFRLSHHFSRGQNFENPVDRDLSLLLDPTETLAAQATSRYLHGWEFLCFNLMNYQRVHKHGTERNRYISYKHNREGKTSDIIFRSFGDLMTSFQGVKTCKFT